MSQQDFLMTPPPPSTVRLLVLDDLQIGPVFYTLGDVVEVSPQEAYELRKNYPDYFEVLR